MATLGQLVAAGALLRFETQLEEWENVERVVYVTPAFDMWLSTVLPGLPKDRGRNLSPLEQVDEVLYEFIAGKQMIYDEDRKRLDPQHLNVWELKTEDVRVFGWFPCRGIFIAVAGEMKKRLKKRSQYAPYIQMVDAFRHGLPLNPPKTTTGVRADEVL